MTPPLKLDAAIVSLCHAYDPDVVVVSGGAMRSAEVILPSLSDYVGTHLWSSSHRPAFVTPSAPEHSVILGLSALAEQADDDGREGQRGVDHCKRRAASPEASSREEVAQRQPDCAGDRGCCDGDFESEKSDPVHLGITRNE